MFLLGSYFKYSTRLTRLPSSVSKCYILFRRSWVRDLEIPTNPDVKISAMTPETFFKMSCLNSWKDIQDKNWIHQQGPLWLPLASLWFAEAMWFFVCLFIFLAGFLFLFILPTLFTTLVLGIFPPPFPSLSTTSNRMNFINSNLTQSPLTSTKEITWNIQFHPENVNIYKRILSF